MRKFKNSLDRFIDSFGRDDVKLIPLLSLFFNLKWFILFSIVTGITIGTIVYFKTPKEYVSSSSLLLEIEEPAIKEDIGKFLGMAGSTGNRSIYIEQLPPDIYPYLIENSVFLRNIINEEYRTYDTNDLVNLSEYLNQIRNTSIPRKVLRVFKRKNTTSSESTDVNITNILNDSTLLYLNSTERAAVNELRDRLEFVKNNRIITLTVKLRDPLLAAKVNNQIIGQFQHYISKYTANKQRKDLFFIQKQYEVAKSNYFRLLTNVSEFQDKNRHVLHETVKSTLQKNQVELNLALNLYTNLSVQLKQAEVKLEEAKPVVSILEKPSFSDTPSEPSLFKCIIIFVLLITFLTILSVFIYILSIVYKKKFKKND